jgi:ABC-type Co2+ transport system permease subunit
MVVLLYVLPVLLLILGPLVAYYCYKRLNDPMESFDATSGAFAKYGNWAGIALGAVAVLWAIWRIYQLFSQP